MSAGPGVVCISMYILSAWVDAGMYICHVVLVMCPCLAATCSDARMQPRGLQLLVRIGARRASRREGLMGIAAARGGVAAKHASMCAHAHVHVHIHQHAHICI